MKGIWLVNEEGYVCTCSEFHIVTLKMVTVCQVSELCVILSGKHMGRSRGVGQYVWLDDSDSYWVWFCQYLAWTNDRSPLAGPRITLPIINSNIKSQLNCNHHKAA